MNRAQVRFEPVGHILPDTRIEMYRLFCTYYQDVSQETFFTDLDEKQLVLMVRNPNNHAVVGFTTIICQEIKTQNGGNATAVFSGDTVMDKAFWGAKIFQWEFTRYLLRLKLMAPHRRLYWMLMSKGFKTYLMVRRNCPRTFPSFSLQEDSDLRFVRDLFYTQRYGSAFDSASGLIKFQSSQGAVAPSYADIDPGASNDPDVAFFLRSNPDHKIGDELACVAEVRLRDFPMVLIKYTVKVIFRFFNGHQGLKKVG